MRRLFGHVATAFSYFSILPVPGSASHPAPDAATLGALPLVGAAIGGLAGGAAWLVSRAAPRPYATATAFALPIVLTGALHLDGFLDCSDGVFASVEPERRLEILRDPRHGTYALAALAVATTFSLATLSTCEPARLARVLAYAGALVRVAAIWNARRFPYGRGGELSRTFSTKPDARVLVLWTLALCAASFAFGRRTWLLVPATCVAARCAGHLLARQLGGALVGDAYGFVIFALEPAVIAIVALSKG